MDTKQLTEAFRLQFPDLSVGGFYNPKFICTHSSGDLEFRCNYDNYGHEEEDDAWTWYYGVQTGRFYN